MPVLARRRPDAPPRRARGPGGIRGPARQTGFVAPASATARASAAVSTSRSRGSSATRRPAWSSRARMMVPVSAVDIGTPRTRAASGTRRPRAQKPPSAAGPNQASAASQSTVSRPGVSCGVSIPMSNAGPSTAANAPASRSSRPPAHCGTMSNPGGSHGPGSPSSTSTRRRAGAASTVCSVSASAASASAAACPGVHGGTSRVLTRPGRGCLAMTSRVVPSGAAPCGRCGVVTWPAPGSCP